MEIVMDVKPIRSPSYPSMSLEGAIAAVAKIETVYRSSPVDRDIGVKKLGYSASSGPANKALAALASFGLVERAGKGMMRVTPLARTILHPRDDSEKNTALMQAAMLPRLFQDIRGRFPDLPIPPEDGVRAYLERQGFNASAVGPAAKAFLETMRFIEQSGASESHSNQSASGEESDPLDGEKITYGGARVGDLIQWESQGLLRLPRPLRVRTVSEDRQWVAVEGSTTGIPMSEVIVDTASRQPTPPPVFELEEEKRSPGFEEWFRAKVGPEKLVVISYRGEGEVGAKEIQKLIDILMAQKAALVED
jgi:hypothetical protein